MLTLAKNTIVSHQQCTGFETMCSDLVVNCRNNRKAWVGNFRFPLCLNNDSSMSSFWTFMCENHLWVILATSGKACQEADILHSAIDNIQLNAHMACFTFISEGSPEVRSFPQMWVHWLNDPIWFVKSLRSTEHFSTEHVVADASPRTNASWNEFAWTWVVESKQAIMSDSLPLFRPRAAVQLIIL